MVTESTRMHRLEVEQNEDGEWVWRFVDRNNEIVSTGHQQFSRVESAINGAIQGSPVTSVNLDNDLITHYLPEEARFVTGRLRVIYYHEAETDE